MPRKSVVHEQAAQAALYQTIIVRAALQLAYSRPVDLLGPGCVMMPRKLYMQIAAADGLLANLESSLVASADLALAVLSRNYSIVYQPTALVGCIGSASI
jgi:hypothetical protein